MTEQERYHAARRDPSLVVLEGFHAIKHALRFGAQIEDMVTDDRAQIEVLAGALAPDQRAALLQARAAGDGLDRLTPTPLRTRLLAIARRPHLDITSLFSVCDGIIVLLDEPRDPGNIGAAVRVAAAAGARAVITTGSADPWHPAAVRGGAGLQFALDVGRINEMPATSRPILALDPEGDEHDGVALPADAIVVFGSERSGISTAVLARASARIRIPMRPGVSSLNLATAVAAVLYGARQ